MPPCRVNRPDPAHLAFRASVTLELGAGHGNQAKWSASVGMPFVRNLAELADSPAFSGVDTEMITHNASAKTALELADGNWGGVAPGLTATNVASSVVDLTEAFTTHIWPSRSQASTRAKHWPNWAVVVTWAIAWGALALILSMATAISWELLCMGTLR
jgi:hypothetical protein